MVRVHVTATPLGKRRLQNVLPSDVQAWIKGRSETLSPSTLRLVASLLRSVLDSAVDDRLIARNPARSLDLPRVVRPRLVPLTATQVGALTAAMPERNRAMVTTQAGLGLRVGELLALRVSDVDFLRREVHVRTQLAPGARTRTDPKTERSKRTLPLPTVVAEALAVHAAAFPPLSDGSLFYTRADQPYRSDYYSLIFARAVVAAELPEGTSSHDLRHAYASWLLAHDHSVVAVAERLGHDSAALVLSTYGHLVPGREEHTRRAIDAAFAAVEVTSGSRSEAPGLKPVT
jgi:integrase